MKTKNRDKFNYRKLVSPFIKERTRAVVNPFQTNEKQKTDQPATIFIYDYDGDNIRSLSNA